MNVLYCVACDIALTGTPVFVRDVISAFPQNKNCVYTPFYVRNNIYPKQTKIYSGNINPSGGGYSY